jgi:hypothetical protein
MRFKKFLDSLIFVNVRLKRIREKVILAKVRFTRKEFVCERTRFSLSMNFSLNAVRDNNNLKYVELSG